LQIELVGKNEFRHAAFLKRQVVRPALNVNKSIGGDLSPSASAVSSFQNLGVSSNFRKLELALGKRLVEHVFNFRFFHIFGHG
jgi:hypothetical protein